MTDEQRIRRIQRWLSKCGSTMPTAWCIYGTTHTKERLDLADELMATELDWVVRVAATLVLATQWDQAEPVRPSRPLGRLE